MMTAERRTDGQNDFSEVTQGELDQISHNRVVGKNEVIAVIRGLLTRCADARVKASPSGAELGVVIPAK